MTAFCGHDNRGSLEKDRSPGCPKTSYRSALCCSCTTSRPIERDGDACDGVNPQPRRVYAASVSLPWT